MNFVERAEALGLTDKEIKFCMEYIETFNASESVRRAGFDVKYPRTKATDLLKKPRIKQFLAEIKQELFTEDVMTATELLTFLSKVVNNKYDEVHSNRSFLPKDRIACAEMLGKYHELFVDRVEQTNEVNIVVDIEDE